jgi:hypothetical protein
MHHLAFPIARGNVLIDTVVPPDKLGKTEITEFAVCFRCTDIRFWDDFPHRFSAVGAFG